jgi:endonuclease/exonuclease/phosphatase family metal-dependent hydrolase
MRDAMIRRAKRGRWHEYEGSRYLRIGSYNIHGCRGVDRRYDTARIARVIEEMDCDTIGLQEVGMRAGHADAARQLEVLRSATQMQVIAGPTLAWHEGDFGNALLTRRKVLAVRRHDLSYERREPRGALEAELDIDGERVHVIVAHLGLRPAERRFQVKKMLRVLHDIPKEQCVVVVGDINEWLPLGRPLRWLHGILGQPPAERSFPVWLPVFALDRVWVRPHGALLTFGVHRSATARVASDHYPVRALVAIHEHRRIVPHA